MIDIFEPLQIPDGFLLYRADRLEKQAGEFGVQIKARWRDRVRLVTSDITQLSASLSVPVVEDLNSLILQLGPPSKTLRYMAALRDFAAHVRAAERAKHRSYERVKGPFGRVHLVMPFESTAPCGSRGFTEPATGYSLTCKTCIGIVQKYKANACDPLVFVDLRPDETLIGNVPVADPASTEITMQSLASDSGILDGDQTTP